MYVGEGELFGAVLMLDTGWILQDFREADLQSPAASYLYVSACILGVGQVREGRDQCTEDW